jgi:hypothetical protein
MGAARERRFTLLELMTVLGVLAVLASMLLPLLANATRQARAHQCADHLRQLGVAHELYADSHDGRFALTHGGLSTVSGSPAWAAASRASMAAFSEGLRDPADTLVCPTFWRPPREEAPPLGRSRARGGDVAWGYQKWAGTLSTKPLTARPDAYSRYQDITTTVTALDPALLHPGYLRQQALGTALRRVIVLGHSMAGELIWQSAYRPLAVLPLRGPGRVPPSEITLWADANNVGEAAWATAHSVVKQQEKLPRVPPVIRGLNELMADGRVNWYGIESGFLYYISDGQPGGAAVLVQDNR